MSRIDRKFACSSASLMQDLIWGSWSPELRAKMEGTHLVFRAVEAALHFFYWFQLLSFLAMEATVLRFSSGIVYASHILAFLSPTTIIVFAPFAGSSVSFCLDGDLQVSEVFGATKKLTNSIISTATLAFILKPGLCYSDRKQDNWSGSLLLIHHFHLQSFLEIKTPDFFFLFTRKCNFTFTSCWLYL